MRRNWLVPLTAATALIGLAVLPALAQSTPGNEGAASPAGAAASLPKSIAFPPVKAGPTRDLGLESAPTVAGLATATKVFGGTETSTPASAALLDAMKSEGTGGAAVAGALPPVTGAPPALAAVADTSVYPYRAIGVVEVTYGPHTYPCTGTLIGPSTVITAASCLWGAEGNPVWADKVDFIPGAEDSSAPYGLIDADSANVMQQFIDSSGTVSSYGTDPFGVGVIHLAQPIGNQIGWLGFQTDLNKAYSPNAVTYGATGQEAEQSTTTCPLVLQMMSRSSAQAAPCQAGPWGSPFFVVDSKKNRFVTGMVLEAAADGSPIRMSARISAVTYQWIADQRK